MIKVLLSSCVISFIVLYMAFAFASLMYKIIGGRTWESNPWVVAYSFELVD